MVDQKFPETDQKFPETGQFFVWSTKKNEKKTGQLVYQETDQNHMDGTIVEICSNLSDLSNMQRFNKTWPTLGNSL